MPFLSKNDGTHLSESHDLLHEGGSRAGNGTSFWEEGRHWRSVRAESGVLVHKLTAAARAPSSPAGGEHHNLRDAVARKASAESVAVLHDRDADSRQKAAALVPLEEKGSPGVWGGFNEDFRDVMLEEGERGEWDKLMSQLERLQVLSPPRTLPRSCVV